MDILSEVRFAQGFPMTRFFYHPLYKVGVGKYSNLDYIFGKDRSIPFKNLRKFKFFTFKAPFPEDSVIFFQPERKRLIIASRNEGKVLKISVSPGQLSLLAGEIKELSHQNNSDFSAHSVKILDHGKNWILTSFCSNLDSVAKMDILQLHDLLMEPMAKYYRCHRLEKLSLHQWLEEVKSRALGHPSSTIVEKLISRIQSSSDLELLKGQIHFDLHQGNVLRAKDQLTIIDWEVTQRGLLLVDYFDFFRRHSNKTKSIDSLKMFYKKYQSWMKQFEIVVPDDLELLTLDLYALERALLYWEKWKEDRFSDKKGFEYKIANT